MTDPTAPDWTPLFTEIPAWREQAEAISARLSATAHGDFSRWQAALRGLPQALVETVSLTDTITVTGQLDPTGCDQLTQALLTLRPWRKGPISLFGISIDTEWRSDWKWRRVRPHLDDLTGRRVLDVGCGNGYFGWRMLDAGARLVAGVDPTLLFCMQHLALNRYIDSPRNWVVPLPFEALPAATFDTVFSMGVIYHRRDPLEHAQRLFANTRPGGQVVLESLVVDGATPLLPQEHADKRYARMRNIWVIPTTGLMTRWLEAAGFGELVVAEVTPTTVEEQRRTDWMPFESLAEALAPGDATRTVEGHPAPQRAVVVGRRPP